MIQVLEILLGEGGRVLVPEPPPKLRDPADREIQFVALGQQESLFLREIPGNLLSGVAGFRHQRRGRAFLFPNLIATDLAHRLSRALLHVDLLEHQHRSGRPCVDGVDIGAPHLAAHAIQLRTPLVTENVEERLQCLQAGAFSATEHCPCVEATDVSDLEVPSLARDLVASDPGHNPDIPLRQSVVYRYCQPPRAGERRENLLPDQHWGRRRRTDCAQRQYRVQDTRSGVGMPVSPPVSLVGTHGEKQE